MSNQICTIERGDNGFIIRRIDDGINYIQVHEDKYLDENCDSKEAVMVAMQEVFQDIMCFFGVYNSNHDRKALSVDIVSRVDFPVGDTINDLRRDRDNLKQEVERLQSELDSLKQPKQSKENVPTIRPFKDMVDRD